MPSLFTNWRKPKPAPTDWEAKYKQAITDLAAARDEVARQDSVIESMAWDIKDMEPDALAMRRKRQMDRDRKKGKA